MAQIFPQADDMNKIIRIVKLDENELNTKKIMDVIDVGTERQVGYYLSACKFLDILNDKKQFSDFGNKLKKCEPQKFIYEISKKIVSKDVFGEVFFESYLKNNKLSTDEVSQLILFYTDVENHQVAHRRAQTVIAWLKWLDTHKV